MGSLKVCAEGLQALAVQCSAASAKLASHTPASGQGLPGQATSSAVDGAYAALRSTSVVLAARAEATSHKLNDAAFRYMTQDENSAQRLSALGESFEV